MILRPLFCFEDTKNTGLFIFNSLKQNQLIANFFVNHNWKTLTDSSKRAKILANNRKSHPPPLRPFFKHTFPALYFPGAFPVNWPQLNLT